VPVPPIGDFHGDSAIHDVIGLGQVSVAVILDGVRRERRAAAVGAGGSIKRRLHGRRPFVAVVDVAAANIDAGMGPAQEGELAHRSFEFARLEIARKIEELVSRRGDAAVDAAFTRGNVLPVQDRTEILIAELVMETPALQ
jgi:hypothetical protein